MTNLLIIWYEILIGLISAFLIYYVRKKGQNQADKDDLKKLTEIVEDVKLRNSVEIESIKANLSLLTDRGKQIFSEEKDSIIVFFAQLNTWIWESLNINFNAIKLEDISKRLIEIQDAYNKTNVAYAKVKLIINDANLVDAGQKAITNTYEVHKFRVSILNQLHGIYRNQNDLTERILECKDENQAKTDTQIKTLIGYDKDYTDSARNLIVNNNQRSILLFDTAMESVNAFRDSAQTYLRKESPTK